MGISLQRLVQEEGSRLRREIVDRLGTGVGKLEVIQKSDYCMEILFNG